MSDGAFGDFNGELAEQEPAPATPVWVYSFSVWPDEKWGFDTSIFDLFRMLTGRVEMEFTERDFELFRSRLSHHGLTLREIERVQFAVPQTVV